MALSKIEPNQDLVPVPNDRKIEEVKAYCISWGIQNECLIADEEAVCYVHNVKTVPVFWGMHICPVCALLQRVNSRQRLDIDGKIQDAIRRHQEAEEAKKAEKLSRLGSKHTKKEHLSQERILSECQDYPPF